MGRVSIVVVTWNSAPFLPRCFDGIANQTHRETELIVAESSRRRDGVTVRT